MHEYFAWDKVNFSLEAELNRMYASQAPAYDIELFSFFGVESADSYSNAFESF